VIRIDNTRLRTIEPREPLAIQVSKLNLVLKVPAVRARKGDHFAMLLAENLSPAQPFSDHEKY
jgi:hypothetical protein